MILTPKKVNAFLFFKLPAAYWCGVRLIDINDARCTTTVKYRWINQNPFKSMYFAVQLMAAELSTGALVMSKIKASNRTISMLVGSQTSEFYKKVTGRVHFTCQDVQLLDLAIQKTIATGEGQEVLLQSTGINKEGDVVSKMTFEWKIKLKS